LAGPVMSGTRRGRSVAVIGQVIGGAAGRGRSPATTDQLMTKRFRAGRRGRHGLAGALSRLRADDGNAPLELVLIAPLILIMIGLVIAAGRVSTAQSAVNAAAREAARQASVAASEGTAEQAAMTGAISALAADGLQCQPE